MIRLTHTTSEDGGTLILHADEEARNELRELRAHDPDWGCCAMESDACDRLLANSELQWINPSDTGDLTDAPILGILGDPQPENSGPYGAVWSGGSAAGPEYQPILERWGYMHYQVRSFLDDLLDYGHAEFVNSH